MCREIVDSSLGYRFIYRYSNKKDCTIKCTLFVRCTATYFGLSSYHDTKETTDIKILVERRNTDVWPPKRWGWFLLSIQHLLYLSNIQRKRYFVPLTLNLISRCYHGFFGRIYNWYQMSKGVTLFTSVKMGDVAGRSKREVTKGAW